MDGRHYCKPRRRLLFSDLASPLELERVLASSTTTTYSEGTKIFSAGDPSESLYVIVEGSVEFTPRGSKNVLDEQFSGEYFGELGVFDSQARSATATATTETTCRAIQRAALFSWLEAHPRAGLALLRHSTLRIRDLSAERARPYQRFVDFVDRNAILEGGVRVIRGMPSITQLARLLDMTREYLTRIMNKLKQLRWITLEDGCLTVLKPLPRTF